MRTIYVSAIVFALLSVTGVSRPVHAENLQHVRQLLSSRHCQNCDLTDSGLAYASLVGADLRGADLRGANLSQADLRGADLSGANLTGTSLNGAILQDANLTAANLRGADLRRAYAVNAEFRDANMSNALLKGAIGLPTTLFSAQQFHNWGVEEISRGNYPGAIDYYTQALVLEPNRATTTINRSLAYLRLNNLNEAMADAQKASALFKEQGNTQAYEATQTLIQNIKQAGEKPEQSGTGIGAQIINGLGSLLPLLLLF